MLDNVEYSEWIDHPVTKKFHKYLEDYRQNLMERWAEGRLQDELNLLSIARCQMADEIISLNASDIAEFYKSIKQGESNASKD